MLIAKVLTNATLQILATIMAIVLMVVVASCSRDDVQSPVAPATTSSSGFIMPNLLGKFWTQAEPELRRAGWTGVLVKGPDLPAKPGDRNRVMHQMPNAGERIKDGDPITVQFGS
jgi:serine/threonine-protein kinase